MLAENPARVAGNVKKEDNMSFALHPRRLVAVAAVGVCAVAGAALVADAGQAHPGRTYTIKTLKTRGSVWIAGGGKAMRVGRLSPGNLTDFVLARSGDAGEKPALIDGPSGRTITYAQLGESVRTVAAGLAERGFGRAASSLTTPPTCRSMRSPSTRSRPSGA